MCLSSLPPEGSDMVRENITDTIEKIQGSKVWYTCTNDRFMVTSAVCITMVLLYKFKALL